MCGLKAVDVCVPWRSGAAGAWEPAEDYSVYVGLLCNFCRILGGSFDVSVGDVDTWGAPRARGFLRRSSVGALTSRCAAETSCPKFHAVQQEYLCRKPASVACGARGAAQAKLNSWKRRVACVVSPAARLQAEPRRFGYLRGARPLVTII